MQNKGILIISSALAILMIGGAIGFQYMMVTTPSEGQPPDDMSTLAIVATDVASALLTATSGVANLPPTAIVATPVPPAPTPIPTITFRPKPPTPAPAPLNSAIVQRAAQPDVASNATYTERILNAENLVISADDKLVVDIVKSNPFAIGFVGRAYYQAERDNLRVLHLQLDNGRTVGPSPDAVFNGSYPLSRLLYIYTTAEIMHSKPEIAAFIGCYLNRINDEILDVGFFPARDTIFQETLQTYRNIMALPSSMFLPGCEAVNASGDINIAGSTTVAPVTRRMGDLFVAAGYQGRIRVDAIGTSAGFERFCDAGVEDIVNADRQLTTDELERCRRIGREPIALAIGEDALSVIVSAQNGFIETASLPQLQHLFTDAHYWSDVNPEWPQELIARITPNQRGGTFTTFVNRVFGETEVLASPVESLPQAPSTPVQPPPTLTVAVPIATEPANEGATNAADTIFTHGDALPLESEYNYVLAFIPQRPSCLLASQIVHKILEENFDIVVWLEIHNDMPELYADYRAIEYEELNHMTVCYVDLDDRTELSAQGDWMRLVGNGYWQNGAQRWYVAIQSSLVYEFKSNRPCLYQFLRNLAFPDGPLQARDADTWLANNAALVDSWLDCSP